MDLITSLRARLTAVNERALQYCEAVRLSRSMRMSIAYIIHSPSRNHAFFNITFRTCFALKQVEQNFDVRRDTIFRLEMRLHHIQAYMWWQKADFRKFLSAYCSNLICNIAFLRLREALNDYHNARYIVGQWPESLRLSRESCLFSCHARRLASVRTSSQTMIIESSMNCSLFFVLTGGIVVAASINSFENFQKYAVGRYSRSYINIRTCTCSNRIFYREQVLLCLRRHNLYCSTRRINWLECTIFIRD